MKERYHTYILARPLQGWLLAVAVCLAFTRVLTWIMPDKGERGLPFFCVLVCIAFASPTVNLMMRLSAEGRRERPIPPEQEGKIATLSLVAGICALCALAVGVIGRWAGWPLDIRVGWLTASIIAALVAAALGYGVRRSRVGRWAMGLSAAWGLLLFGYVVVRLFWRAAGHV